jgi:hypothetical protein
MRQSGACRTIVSGAALAATLLLANPGPVHGGNRFDGLNVVAVPEHPYGSASAKRALATAKRLGATTIAIVPFLWQASPTDPAISRGKDMSDDDLRSAIRDARALGLTVMIKPHVWVPESWAGAITLASEEDWRRWFDGYRAALASIVAIATEENAHALVIGTELAKTTHRAEWFELIRSVRAIFPGKLLYVAHNADEAETIAFWPLLDFVGVSLYPPLGADGDRSGRLSAMYATARRLDQIAARTDKRILVGEIGLRSAQGAAAKPWESAEERQAAADPWLQAEVLADWLAVLRRPSVRGVMVWRWFTDPSAGGRVDTDFTVQGKPAEGVLMCAWTMSCGR